MHIYRDDDSVIRTDHISFFVYLKKRNCEVTIWGPPHFGFVVDNILGVPKSCVQGNLVTGPVFGGLPF